MIRALVVVGSLFWLAAPLLAQGPEADWRTLETEHFRVRYPAPAEAWSRRAASRLEAIRERVGREVGFLPEDVTEVLVMDPAASANGTAWPILGRPRLVLWTTPPGPDSSLGYYRDWGETLAIHEVAHLAHLLRPSRNGFERFVSRWIPVGPLALRSPRWVVEGYATLLEGELTGQGRPNGDLRATLLRRQAQSGELPSYGGLSSGETTWLGPSMAYLGGSAFLEWLRDRAGPESLRQLWARLSARHRRSFEDAFTGIFGDPPADLYNRFRAELSYRALRLEAERAPLLREGELWQDLSWTTGPPAVSPEGDRLAIVLRSRRGPSRLVVWSTGPNEAAEARWREEVRRLIERDPQDVPPVRTRPLPREPLAELVSRNGAEPSTPRWSRDGRSLLYVRFEPDARGVLHPDLFRWHLEGGRVERLTVGADLRDPDPAPDGRWAVAVRHRWGLSQLVRVELSGPGRDDAGKDNAAKEISVTPMTEPSLDEVYAQPRFDPAGERLAFVRHRGGRWRLVVRSLGEGGEVELPVPAGASVARPAWSGDGRSIFATVGAGGFLEIWRFEVDPPREAMQVTFSQGAALAPAPTPDGEALFYLDLDAEGLDLRHLDLRRSDLSEAPPTPSSTPTEPMDLAPVVRPALPAEMAPPTEAALPEARPYGLGRLELLPLLGGRVAPSGHGLELGLRAGDVVGRAELVALASQIEGGVEGGALHLAWRGWPIALSIHLYRAEEKLSEQPVAVPGLGTDLDFDRQGIELVGAWSHLSRGRRFEIEIGGHLGEVTTAAGVALRQESLFVDTRYRLDQRLGRWRFFEQLAISADLGRTAGEGWRRHAGELHLGLERGGARLAFTWARRGSRDLRSDADRFQLGGLGGSILPRSALGARIPVPALPTATFVGDQSESQRLELHLGSLPLRSFVERHRLWLAGEEAGAWLELWGIEIRRSQEPFPILRLPGFDARLGIAQVHGEPFRDKVRAWLALSWRP